MAFIATLASLPGFGFPGLRDSWIGQTVVGLTREVERFILMNPGLHHFVDHYPGLAALTASAGLWLVALLFCHLAFSIFVKIFDNPWRPPRSSSNYVMNPESEPELQQKSDVTLLSGKSLKLGKESQIKRTSGNSNSSHHSRSMGS